MACNQELIPSIVYGNLEKKTLNEFLNEITQESTFTLFGENNTLIYEKGSLVNIKK